MDNTLYPYSPIIHRPKLSWPNGARVAFYVGVNVEHFEVDKPSSSIVAATAHYKPDPLNFGWRDYGARVGIWRMFDALDAVGMRASVLLNSDVVHRYPQIIEAGNARNWAWLAHGKTNSILQGDIPPEQEKAFLTDVVKTIADGTGRPVRGWMGPGLSETFQTPKLLADLGVNYVLDWTADDQPFSLDVPGLISIPYSVELNDFTLFLEKGVSGEEFYRVVIDQLDRLWQEGETSGRVMALAVHPFIVNQPFRQKYLEKALAYIAGHEGVWLTTSDDIAAHYIATRATAQE